MQIFEVILFFKLRTKIQQKTVKPTYLCPLDARKLAGGKGFMIIMINAKGFMIIMINAKLRMMVVLIELYQFIPLSVTVIVF